MTDTEPTNYDYQIKVIVIGDSGVGKTQYCMTSIDGNQKTHNLVSTIGVEYYSKIIDIDDKKIRIQTWDTAGQERFRSITRVYYKGVSCGMIFFDLCDRSSFNHVPYWLDEIRKNRTVVMNIMLVGSFSDLPSRQVSFDEADKLAKLNDMEYMEITCLKPNLAPIKTLCRRVLQRIADGELLPLRENGISVGAVKSTIKPSSSKSCCVIS